MFTVADAAGVLSPLSARIAFDLDLLPPSAFLATRFLSLLRTDDLVILAEVLCVDDAVDC
jgi:hypothetical protein